MRIGVFFPSSEHRPVDEMVGRADRVASALDTTASRTWRGEH
jgi:hypothetical protein